MLRRSGFILVTLALLLAGSLPVSWAARLQQARVRRLKACVLLVPSLGEFNASAPADQPDQYWAGAAPDPDAISRQRSPNPNPHLFYVLDQRKDLKPDGWDFANPAAPPYVTRNQALRWPGLSMGAVLRPDMAPYWEVTLSNANFGRLSEMDVVYLPIARVDSGGGVIPTYFTEEQRRLLTRLADSGVTIWVDWAMDYPTSAPQPLPTEAGVLGGNTANPPKNAFFTNLDFMTAGSTPASLDPVRHPLLAGQYLLSRDEDLLIGSSGAARAIATRVPGMQQTAHFSAVVGANGATAAFNPAYVAAARFGAGYVVATAGNVGRALTRAILPSDKPQVVNDDLGSSDAEDLKFAYNLFAWASEVTAPQKNGRHTGQSSVQVNGMIEQASYPGLVPVGGGWNPYPSGAASPNNLCVHPASPLIVNGVVISATRYRDAGGTLRSELNATEANPYDDFNRDGFLDDPISASGGGALADLSIGQAFDRIMTIGPNLPLITGLTLGEAPEATPQHASASVFVTGARDSTYTGLYSLPAPRPGLPPADYWSGASAQMAPNPLDINFTGAAGFVNLPGPGNTVLSQVFAGGTSAAGAFGGASGNGKVVAYDYAADPMSMSTRPVFSQRPVWAYPPNAEANRVGPISGPCTVAQVQDTSTGAIDTMLITTSLTPDTGAATGGDQTGKVLGFVLLTRGDVLTFPRGNNAPGGMNPNAGRIFVAARWLDVPVGAGVVPSPRELMWDPARHFEIRVMDKERNYVLKRYVAGVDIVAPPAMPSATQGTLMQDGTGGQIMLPPPPNGFSVPGQPRVWDLNRFVFVADYSPLPQPSDQVGGQQGFTMRPRFTPVTPFVRVNNQEEPTGVAGGVAVGKDNLIYYGTGKGYMCASEWQRGRATFRWKMRSLENPMNGRSRDVDPTSPNYLSDYAFTAPPAAGDRIVFAARGAAAGTVYMMEPDATIRFKLRLKMGDAITTQNVLDVMLQGDHGQNLPQDGYIAAGQQPWGRVRDQFVVDPDTGAVTFLNMDNFSLDLSQARSPSELAAIGVDTGGRPAVPIRWKFRNEAAAAGNDPARESWIPLPLVAIYRPTTPVADRFPSGPVISGDRVYLMGESGFLHELPLDPKLVNPNFPVAGAFQAGFNLGNVGAYGAMGMRRYRNIAAGTGIPVLSSPAISDGLVAITSPRGLTTYSSPNIVVADNNRVIEASGDSVALASTDVALKHRIDTSEFAIPTDPSFANTGNRPILTERKQLSRLSVVRKLTRGSSLTAIFNSTSPESPGADDNSGVREHSEIAEESYLAADTGNNRCVEFNPAGKVVWELDQFQDPFNLLPAGEPLKLSAPMDVQRWIEVERHPSAGDLQVIHTLITDTGNNRILEIVDKVRYQRGVFNAGSYPTLTDQIGPDGQPIRWYHALVWTSQTNAQGLRLRYRTAQRIFWPDANGVPIQVGPAAGPLPAQPPFWLPPERYLSYTMATISGQQVFYPPAPRTAYFQFYGAAPPGGPVYQRKPETRAGGDSIVFLRGRWKVESAGAPQAVTTHREASTGASEYRFAQGVIDPNVPIINEIWDELNLGQGNYRVIRRLQGINSIQRTLRSDVKFAPETYAGNAAMVPQMYFLIADAEGVWELRMLSAAVANGLPPNAQSPTPQAALAWGFSAEDYAYVTGAGNGDPTRVFSRTTTDHNPGGRRLTAASARRMPNGLVLVTSRTPSNQAPVPTDPGNPSILEHVHAGADVFLLRANDFRIRPSRGAPYDRVAVALHGWQPDQWLQDHPAYRNSIPPFLRGAPSIIWRAASLVNPSAAPRLDSLNPYELTGSYAPVQPNYADLVYK